MKSDVSVVEKKAGGRTSDGRSTETSGGPEGRKGTTAPSGAHGGKK